MNRCSLSPESREVGELCKPPHPRLCPPSPPMDSDSQDSLCRVLGRHLLTSTMQRDNQALNPRQTSPPAFTILNQAPTPSPSPFPSIPDLNFSLSSPRLQHFVQHSQQSATTPHYEELVMEQAAPQATSLLLPMDPPGPPARGLSYSASTLPGPNLSYSASTLPGPNQRQLLLVESAPSSLPLGLVQPSPLSTTSLTTLPSSLIQNKKRRLLTFLSEQADRSQPEQEQQLLFSRKDKFHTGDKIMLEASHQHAPMSLYSSLPSTALLTESDPMVLAQNQTLTTILPLAKASPELQSQPTTLIIEAQQAQPQTKPESTLIINSQGTAATLYTPATAFTPATACTVPVSDSLQLALSSQAPMLAPTYALMTTSPLTTSGELLPTSSLLPSSILSFATSPKPSTSRDLLEPALKEWTETVICYKCKLCGYLALSATGLKHHLIDDHEECGLETEDTAGLASSWLPTALRAGIQLCCPVCPNMFNSGRSFKVHLDEDHGWSESQAEAELARRNEERREKVVEVIAEEKKRQREERKRKKQTGFEAYVDSNNELRIRVPKGCDLSITSDSPDEQQSNSEEEIDVTRDDEARLPRAAKTASSCRSRRPAKKRSRSGKGRRGELRTEEGEACGVAGCGLSFSDSQHLLLHRRSHREDGTFSCPLCTEEPVASWPPLSLHLWRAHSMDLGLLRCSSCSYRCHTRAKLTRHEGTHSEIRPWLCPLCGQAFKLSKQLRAHARTHRDGGEETVQQQLACHICQATFTLARHLKFHVESVHKKTKKCLCSFCGYAASSRSALQLHVRKHTGDKPFRCGECDYSTADHNSLRRHKMRHSGLRPYQCAYCPYTSIQSSTYKVHLRTKHSLEDMTNLLHQCGLCPFRTLKESTFLTHVASHSGDTTAPVVTKSEPQD